MKAVRFLVVAFACVLALAGCAGKGSLSDDIDDTTGAFTFTADDAGKDSTVGSLGGGIDIKDGQILVVSPNLEKGSLQLGLMDEEMDVALDETVSGRQLSTHQLDAGSYSIMVKSLEDGTTGTMVVVAVDADEFEKQNKDLEAVLANVGVDANEATSSSE